MKTFLNYLTESFFKENLTIPQNKDDKIEVELYKKLENNYDHSDRIVRWYRNAKKSGMDENELKKTFIDNIVNIKDLLKTYDSYIDSLKKMKMLNKKVELDVNGKKLQFDPVKDIDKIRRLEGFQLFVKAVGDMVHSGTSIETSVQKYAITDEDRKNIKLVSISNHVMCWSTKGYETTNKFIFQLWQNAETLGRGDVYGNPTHQTPYCTHSKELWNDYSDGDSDYEQYWFLKRIETLDVYEDINLNYETGDLNNENVVQVFKSMKGLGKSILIAMNDTNGDFLDKYDETIYKISNLDYGYEIKQLLDNDFVDFDNFTVKIDNKDIQLIFDDGDKVIPKNGFDLSKEKFDLDLSFGDDTNGITTLKGCPQIIRGEFRISQLENLTSLKYGPTHVRNYIINDIKINSLDYFAKQVGLDNRLGKIQIKKTLIESLNGLPPNFTGEIYLYDNKLTDLSGCPNELEELYIYNEKSLSSLKGIGNNIFNLVLKYIPNLKSLDGLHSKFSKFQRTPRIYSGLSQYISENEIRFFITWFNKKEILEQKKHTEEYKLYDIIFKLLTGEDGTFSSKNIAEVEKVIEMNAQELEQYEKSLIKENDFPIEETETSKTISNLFEVEIKDNIRKFLDSQSDKKYNNLIVNHYEESDSKYHSDVYVENPENNNQVWIEVKLNKYANLGGLSFKYIDGEWTCTTTDNSNPLTEFYLNAINEYGKKFIEFCKSYLKRDDFSLPKDMSDDLLDAWKNSGSIEDTENNTQFITEKIPIEDFGFLISKFYQSAKNEPVYYIQVDDDLYIIDKNYNPLGLKTQSGEELKSLEEAYRIGRVQFRVKAMNKNNTRYFAIVIDVKILSDKENLDKDYSCSFKTEEKFPIIENITEINETEDLKLLTNLSNDLIKNIIDNEKIENKRFERVQFSKYFEFDSDNYNWCVLSSKDENLAIALINDNTPYDDYYYISEIQSLKKGYGKKLLEELFKKYKKVWLMSNTTAGDSLLNFYRSLNLKEIIIPNSVYGCPAYFYCTKQCDYNKLENYCESIYADGEEELQEADKDIGGEVSDTLPDGGIKIWIDDLRPAPEGFKWFKRVDNFINWLYERNTTSDITLIDTDHDAGEYQQFGGNYINIFKYLDVCGVKNLTIHIHSANPVGANNIRQIIQKNKEINNWKEIRNRRKK